MLGFVAAAKVAAWLGLSAAAAEIGVKVADEYKGTAHERRLAKQEYDREVRIAQIIQKQKEDDNKAKREIIKNLVKIKEEECYAKRMIKLFGLI